ncbi:MAG: hypothetical protein WCH05_05005 [Chlorobiaceae bacterium]
MKKKLSGLFMAILFATSAHASEIPIGYPFSFWSEAHSDNNRSAVTGRFEQGVAINEYMGWDLVPFVAMGASSGSKQEEYWTNEIAPEVGVKVTRPFKLTSEGWGTVSIGVRRKWDEYFSRSATDLSSSEIFLQFGFGGDWKNH